MSISNYAGKHQYLTPPSLARHTAQLAKRFVPDDTVLIDPCSGTGAIFELLRSPKVARDIDPGFCDTPLDFLKASRTDFVSAGQAAAICMNPPFRIQNQQKSAVVQFLNHAATCILRTGEWIVCIAPQQIRKPMKKKCDRIHDTLHLEHESIFEAMQPFHDVKKNKSKHVRVVVQVWRVIEDHIERPVFQQIQVPDFRLSYDPTPMPHFFIRIWTTMNQIGAVVACDDDSYSLQLDESCTYNKTRVWIGGKKIGTFVHNRRNKSTKSGTIVGVHVKDGVDPADVLATFERLHQTNYWQRYKQHTFSGSNNPQISKSEVCLGYLDKLQFPRDPEEVVPALQS